jgi:hypothetical protein
MIFIDVTSLLLVAGALLSLELNVFMAIAVENAVHADEQAFKLRLEAVQGRLSESPATARNRDDSRNLLSLVAALPAFIAHFPPQCGRQWVCARPSEGGKFSLHQPSVKTGPEWQYQIVEIVA